MPSAVRHFHGKTPGKRALARTGGACHADNMGIAGTGKENGQVPIRIRVTILYTGDQPGRTFFIPVQDVIYDTHACLFKEVEAI